MKRGQRWSAAKKGGDSHLDSGPLRRRKALRHLDSLALDPQRDLSPAAAHVRVLGDPTEGPSRAARPAHQANGGAPMAADEADEADEADQARQVREVGARVQPVPIEQPLGVDRPL
jgi:hypothetical protein